MSLAARLKRQSTLTGLGTCFFGSGLIFLFVALYHDRRGPLLWIAAVLLIGAVASWLAAARAGEQANLTD